MYMTAQTTKSIEMDIINNQGPDGCMRGAATWMARVLKAEESQIILAIDIRKSVRVRPLLSYHYLPLSYLKLLPRCTRMIH